MKPKEFSAEVSGGYLLVAIKIPTYTCAICAAIYTPNVDVGYVAHLYEQHYPLSGAFTTPWCGKADWMFIDNGKAHPENRRTLICKTCGASVKEITEGNEAQLRAINNALAAKVTSWEE